MDNVRQDIRHGSSYRRASRTEIHKKVSLVVPKGSQKNGHRLSEVTTLLLVQTGAISFKGNSKHKFDQVTSGVPSVQLSGSIRKRNGGSRGGTSEER